MSDKKKTNNAVAEAMKKEAVEVRNDRNFLFRKLKKTSDLASNNCIQSRKWSKNVKKAPQTRPFFYGLLPPRPGLMEKGSAASHRRCRKQPGTHVVLCFMHTKNHPISNLHSMQSYHPSVDSSQCSNTKLKSYSPSFAWYIH